jgi:poly-gamma-glutamate capsule biosynthesis protein CapA/YwtB (metallophosphatase superfamily)
MKLSNFFIRYVFLIQFILSATLIASSQSQITPANKISLLFIGDIMGHDDQIISARDTVNQTYNYDEVFRYIKPAISEADITIANFEVTLAGQPYAGYPRFSSPVEMAVACRNAGIDYLVTANNHAADRKHEGIISTINKLDSVGIPHTGTFLNSADRDSLTPLMIKKDGTSIALLNYTYGINAANIPNPAIVNMLDKELITNDVNKAKDKNADIIILFLHWGIEYDTVPSEYQTDLVGYFFSIGVDIVIGSHPHVLQKMVWNKNEDTGKDKIAVYSLGNFVSNQRKPKTDGGSMVRIELLRNSSSIQVSNAEYCLTWVYNPVDNNRKKYFILPCSEFENRPDFFINADDFTQMKRFISDSRELLNQQNINIKEHLFN